MLESSDNNFKFKVALTVLNAATGWQRPQAPGHTAAKIRVGEDRIIARRRMSHWEREFIAQGGNPEDFTTALLAGIIDPHANFAAPVEQMENPNTPDSDSNQNGSGETQ